MTDVVFSLIVATKNRTAELERLFDSLALQTHPMFEIILVDQNHDGRLSAIVNSYSERLWIRHLLSNTTGLSAARNEGLAHCKGEVVAFPDDDCWYPTDLLERIGCMFAIHREWDAVSGREASSLSGKNGRFDQTQGRVNHENVWRRHISFTLFFRTMAIRNLAYDTSLGVGSETIWGAGEETDFLLRLVSSGKHVQYEPSIVVLHPDWSGGPYTMNVIKKAHKYGMGMGRILHVHRYPSRVIVKSFIRPLLGSVYTLLKGKPGKALYHLSIFTGRSYGWLLSLHYGTDDSKVKRLQVNL